MRFASGARAVGLAAVWGVALAAGAARAEPEGLVKCEGPAADAMRWTRATDWKTYPNPLSGVTITRDKGKFAIEVAGQEGYSSHTVFALPMQNIRDFKVLRVDG